METPENEKPIKKLKWYISPKKIKKMFRECGASMIELSTIPYFVSYLEKVVKDITIKANEVILQERRFPCQRTHRFRIMKKHIKKVLEHYQLPPSD